MIRFVDATKIYSNGVVGLKNVTVKIDKGEFVFIIGASGSGKSAFLKLIMHEETPTEGEVYVNGYSVHNMPKSEVPYLRRSLGIVFQDFRLLPNKTAYDNVAFAMQIVEALPREIRRQVPLALGLVGLSKKAKAYPSQLSGGEQQRVALARALVNNPAVLIADEPTGNLDPKTSMEIMELLDEINQRGTTVIVATHEKSIVDAMKKRVITLDRGELISDVKKGSYTNED
ncbi:MAG TPA: cell division ATP-binding protein FtsE [Thermoclostridium caenicola]|uniref:cell division ATP-binding protein FtsE n=1 Tax=Thermoclostridium caenicola TaxID=659425 RepID=UPI002CC0521B|nr:cell division ATP-binding protein FtsE [Thermoclostridium caenicola]HOK42833.1 cell division ATP-binding protein FtsE [Thermoclostridium caenicola]HOL84904.1 cell division ATP-binding protein FtsE [Thermoclostridium caenicola]HPO77358.1 cell division ATP-binding protein FtsE [Thermoclostridium caenicola]